MADSEAYSTWNDTGTYKVLRDAIDEGKDFEKAFTALVSLKLCLPPLRDDLEDFEMATNVAGFGNMDDLVLKLRHKDGFEKTMAVQLKHSASKTLTKTDFVHLKGDFNPKKYLETFSNLTEKSPDLIFVWYTNKKMMDFKQEYVLRYDEIKHKSDRKIPSCKIKIVKDSEDWPWFLDILRTKGEADAGLYKLKIEADGELDQDCQSEIRRYEEFFRKLFVSAGQKNKSQVEHAIIATFADDLGCQNKDVLNNYVNFIDYWCGLTGLKEKLTRSTIFTKLSQVLLTPYIRTITTCDKSCSLWRMIGDAILDFDVTMIDSVSDNTMIQSIWSSVSDRDDQIVSKLLKKYGLKSARPEDDLFTKTLISWFLHHIPLIVQINDNNTNVVHQAIEWCRQVDPKLKFVLVGSQQDMDLQNCLIFKRLSDLKSYQDLAENIQVQIQGRRKVSLRDILQIDDSIAQIVTVHQMLLMAEGSLNVGEDLEWLPSPYVTRFVPKIVMKPQILNQLSSSDHLIVVNCSLERNLEDQLQVTAGQNVIFVRDGEQVCTETGYTNVHNFRLMQDGNLEWISTEGEVEPITKFRQKLVKNAFVQDKDVFKYFQKKVGLMCEDPGMGKSVMVSFIKNHCPWNLWPIRINLREHYRLFDIERPNMADLDHILDQVLPECDTFATQLRAIYRRNNRLLLLWDGLDELMSETSIDSAIAVMRLALDRGFPQWIATRPHLQARLEREFNILAVTLKKLDRDEQRWYIRERLKNMLHREGIAAEALEQMMSRVTASVKVSKYRDILGVPLQMFMVTEICQNVENFRSICEGFLGLSELYGKFVEGKFDNAYQKAGQEEPKNSIEKYHLNILKTYQMNRYKIAALKTLFGDAILTKLGAKCDDLVEHIRQDGDVIGLISKIEQNGDFVFTHNTYAEFLCALYFYENWRSHRKVVEAILDYDRHVIRYFFDAMLAHKWPLHKAILDEDETNVSKYVEKCVNDRDEGGRTPLHLAAIIGDAGLVSTLLRHKADRQSLDYFGYTPADWSARYGYRDTLKVVMSAKSEDELKDVYAQLVQLLIDYEANVNSVDVNKNLPLHWSSRYGFKDAVQFLIDAGIDIDFPNKYGETALHVAVLGGQPQTVELLLSNNARVNSQNRGGRTPLHEAADLGHLDILHVLLRHDADPQIPDSSGLKALDLARQNQHWDIVKVLADEPLEFDSDPLINQSRIRLPSQSSVVDEEGSTLMFGAAFSGQLDAIKELIDQNEEINAINKHGKTPLHKAARHGLNDIVETLIRGGADLNIKDHSGQTALHYAVANRRFKTVEILMENGADKSIEDDNGLSAVQLAEELGYNDLVTVMKNKLASKLPKP